jgi:hypothetical protein
MHAQTRIFWDHSKRAQGFWNDFGIPGPKKMRVWAQLTPLSPRCGGADYVGMTCADYKATPIDMVATAAGGEVIFVHPSRRRTAAVY